MSINTVTPSSSSVEKNQRDLRRTFQRKSLSHGKRWGDWVFDGERLALVLRGEPTILGKGADKYVAYLGSLYEVDIESIRQSSEMLDWIFQVRTLGWVDAKCLSDFLKALHDIFHPQANLCSFGSDKRIENPGAFLRQRMLESERIAA